ncbi:heterokaryon incompatibility protein-domain-containing protein [Xylaria nigripes]|nr:heterokaryon incompatibility protein-domain-containing protein [Xylaria nigripes]
MALFRYEPLPPIAEVGRTPHFTRLMGLAPGVGPQILESLSYVWDTEKAHQPIKCYGYDIPITLNLQNAWLALRHPTLFRPLWVDAICINQQDVHERARQVTYMRLVYQHASRVVVWLGPESPIIRGTLSRARELCEYRAMLLATNCESEGLTAPTALMSIQVDRMMIESLMIEAGSAEAATQSLSDLVQLFEGQYFERVWYIQEVVASRDCICKCGNIECDLYALLSLTGLINELRGSQRPNNPLRFWSHIYRQRNREWKPHALKVEGSVGSALQFLMNMRNFQATDPRDRLFAIFGISDDDLQPVIKAFAWYGRQNDALGLPRSDRNPALTPNYTKSVMEVYRDFTRYMVRKSTRVLDVLSHVQHVYDPSPGASCPSWVPRFDAPQACSFFIDVLFLAGIPLNGRFSTFALLHDSPLRRSPMEPDVLQLDGFRVDRVASVSGPVETHEAGNLPVELLWSELFAFPLFPRTISKYIGGVDQLDTAFFLTLCAGGTGLVVSRGDRLGRIDGRLEGLQTLAEHVRNQARHWLTFIYGFPGPACPYLMPQSQTVRDIYLDIIRYQIGAWGLLNHRLVFLTQQGYLGLGPDIMKPGDQVVALFGGHMAFAMRHVSLTNWVLIGHCYLHHWMMMTGQLAEHIRKGRLNLSVETFRIV